MNDNDERWGRGNLQTAAVWGLKLLGNWKGNLEGGGAEQLSEEQERAGTEIRSGAAPAVTCADRVTSHPALAAIMQQ